VTSRWVRAKKDLVSLDALASRGRLASAAPAPPRSLETQSWVVFVSRDAVNGRDLRR